MDALIGKTLSHYRFVEKIGAGGMGEVYRARDTRLGRDVAIKVISPEVARDPDRIKRFEQEARAAGALSHPNVCAIHDVGEHEGAPFVVMELLEGESLHEKLAAGPIPVRKSLDYVAQAARGLAAAHEKGIVHRDLKPANLFVTRDGRVKVLDFGLAKLTRPEVVVPSGEAPRSVAATETGVLLGTVGYMSPEQVRGEPADARSDLFAMGAILYELLTGKRAFHGATYVETLSAILHADPPPLSASGRAIPAGLEPVVRRCLEKSAAERFQSASDLAFDLEQASGIGSGEVPVQARPRSRGRVWVAATCAVALGLVLLAAGRLSVDEPRVDLAPYRLTPFATQLRFSSNPAWSRDGKSIAFVGSEQGAGFQVWVQGISAPTPVQLTRPPFYLGGHGWLSWSSDSRMIYCDGAFGSRDGIFGIPVQGGDPVLVQMDALMGSLSPDGKTLVMLAREAPDKDVRVWFASPPDGTRHLYEPAPLALSSVLGQPQMAFSPDGRSVLVSVWGDNGRQFWRLPWPPGKGRRIPALEGAAQMEGLSWMADSRHVVFSYLSDPEQPWSLHMADVQTGRHWPILVGNNPLMWLAVSPDGRRIAFTAATSHTDVIEVPLDGRPSRTLLGGGREEVMPRLSADARQLVYVTNARGPMEIWAMDMRDESVRRLLTPSDIPPDSGCAAEILNNPVLSRDGRRLAFTAESKRGEWLYISYAAGAAPVRATTSESGPEQAPTWSPEGDRIAYIQHRGVRDALLVIRVGGKEPPVQLMDDVRVINPEWSPTGEWIATADTSHLLLVSPDGRARRELPGEVGPLAWSRDGRTLYVVRHGVRAIDVRTGQERLLRVPGYIGPGGFMKAPGVPLSVTADGKALVYSVVSGGNYIWLLDGVKTPKPWYARLW